MSFLKNKQDKSPLAEQMGAQAKRLGISIEELKKLADGKSCPKYGTAELLHARRNRGGAIMVFNISEKFRGEKISDGRKLLKQKRQAQVGSQSKE